MGLPSNDYGLEIPKAVLDQMKFKGLVSAQRSRDRNAMREAASSNAGSSRSGRTNAQASVVSFDDGIDFVSSRGDFSIDRSKSGRGS
jgi:hypothetical protein